MRPVDRVADALAPVQPLRAAFRVPAAALQQPDLGAVADQLAGDADPCRPGPDDADVHLDLLVVGKLPRLTAPVSCAPFDDRLWRERALATRRLDDSACGAARIAHATFATQVFKRDEPPVMGQHDGERGSTAIAPLRLA